jgi:hypothetical protein
MANKYEVICIGRLTTSSTLGCSIPTAKTPCQIGDSKTAALVKYQVTSSDGRRHFGWILQPNTDDYDAGCLLDFASFSTGEREEASTSNLPVPMLRISCEG